MLAVITSLIGAAVLALVALLASIRMPKSGATPHQRLVHDVLKMVTAGGLATGFVLIAVSLSKVAHVASDSAEMAMMLGIPVMTMMIIRVLQAWSRAEADNNRLHTRADAA
jgi:hypothetical protein